MNLTDIKAKAAEATEAVEAGVASYGLTTARRDLLAALAVTFMAVPQGVAYAVIAGLPPVMGLYAAAVPTIVGSLFRSSSHVVTGPTNAVSLLVAGGVAAMAGGMDPVQVGVTLALLVGIFQFAAGILRLGSIVDFISNPVVLGYITGAGLLIGIGQLPNVTGTSGASGNAWAQIVGWIESLGGVSWLAVVVALGTAGSILMMRRLRRSMPAAIIALGVATAASFLFDLHGYGMTIVSDLTPVPSGLPPLTIPSFGKMEALIGLAVAATVLSLVESSAVARSIAGETGQRLDTSREFTGQGLANLAAAFFGAYPTSGSLSRSSLNHSSGAETRMGGVFAGLFMLLVLLFLGPVVDYTPVAALAGLLLVVAAELTDLRKIRVTMRSPWADRVAFTLTLFGTWVLPLHEAIYLGVGISLVLFLRKARFLHVHELGVDPDDRLYEVDETGTPVITHETCHGIRILHVEGHLFFGVAGELQNALDDVIADGRVEVLILRLRRARNMDITVATIIAQAADRLERNGHHLVLAGVRPDVMKVLQKTDIADAIGEDEIFESRAQWFASIHDAVQHAAEMIGEDHGCEECPFHRYLDASRYDDAA